MLESVEHDNCGVVVQTWPTEGVASAGGQEVGDPGRLRWMFFIFCFLFL